MTNPSGFQTAVDKLISRHPETPLANRWAEAQSTEPSPTPAAYWIRESEDLINVVWLTTRGIGDITWIPARQMSTFIFLKISQIVGAEIREAPGAGEGLGLPVSGNFAVFIRASSDRASLVWVASDDPDNVSQLRSFAGQVLRATSEG